VTDVSVELADESGGRGGAAVLTRGVVGMVHSVAEWWLAHPTMSRGARVDRPVALARPGVVDGFAPATDDAPVPATARRLTG
jgi:hypothetical protein